MANIIILLPISLLVLLLLLLPLLLFLPLSAQAQWQFIPIPPPSSENNDFGIIHKNKNDHIPPKIELTNKSLIIGKNVIKVQIDDNNTVAYGKLEYEDPITKVYKTLDLIRHQGTLYEALLDAQVSTLNLKIIAGDVNNNTSVLTKKIAVLPLNDPLSQLSNFFSNLLSRIETIH
jgi:hypothetical protein